MYCSAPFVFVLLFLRSSKNCLISSSSVNPASSIAFICSSACFRRSLNCLPAFVKQQGIKKPFLFLELSKNPGIIFLYSLFSANSIICCLSKSTLFDLMAASSIISSLFTFSGFTGRFERKSQYRGQVK